MRGQGSTSRACFSFSLAVTGLASNTDRHRRRPASRFSSLADRVRLLRRSRRLPGPRRGRRGDRAGAARGQRQPRRRSTPPATASRRSSRQAEDERGPVPRLRPARGDLRGEHDLARTSCSRAPRVGDFSPATRSSSPRWTTTAASRPGSSSPTTRTWSSSTSSFVADTTLDYDDLERKLSRPHAGGRVRLGLERGRHDGRRPARVRDGPRRRRAGLDRRRPLRRPRRRSTCARSAPTC